MIRKWLTLFLIVAMSIHLQSQSFEFEVYRGQYLEADPGEDIVFDVAILNHSWTNLMINVTRDNNDLDPGWTSELCIDNDCNPPFIDNLFFVLKALDGANISLIFKSGPERGMSHATIQILNWSFPDNFVDLDFYASTGKFATGVLEAHPNQQVSIFPNPAKDHFIVSVDGDLLNKYQKLDLEIINSIGQQLLTTSITQENQLVKLTELSQGTYLFKISSETGFYDSGLFIAK